MDKRYKTVYLSLGSNQGDRLALLNRAIREISKEVGIIKKRSSVYQTEAWGTQELLPFLNQVVEVNTLLNPMVVLKNCLLIEKKMGRNRHSSEVYEDRLIDIDLLFFDEVLINENELTIPHPKLHLRKFVLAPLSEIAPHFFHPVLKKPIWQVLEESEDQLKVDKVNS